MSRLFAARLVALICNLLIVVCTAASVLPYVFKRENGFLRVASFDTFRFFTTDSNVLVALAALILIPLELRALLGGPAELPGWAITFKYVGTVAVTVTFLTVMCFLGPTQGYDAMLRGSGLYVHLIGPLLALASLCLFESGHHLSWARTLWALLPVFLYGTVYLIEAVAIGKAKGGWEDFYGFNAGGRWPVSYLAMHVASYAVCAAIRLLYNACSRFFIL